MKHLALLLALVVVPACKKKDDAGAAPTADKPAAAAGGPVKTTPQDLFADFSPASKLDGMALLDKYREGATFTGKIKIASANPNGDPILFMDVDGGKTKIDLGFTDPSSVKSKNLKVGDSLTVTCKIGGEVDALMQVTDCTAK